jgi:hypothetical protein
MFIMNVLLQITKFRVGYMGVLGLGFIMVYVYYEFAFQSTGFGLVKGEY